jgi:hypothetical protein
MSKQNANNHLQYYIPHHFVFYPIGLAGMGFGIAAWYFHPENCWLGGSITLMFALVIWLSYMMRQHYALTLQDRLVRMEMRLRYYQLTNERFEKHEATLSFGQIAALRFASDEELPALVQRTIKESLSSKDIKKAIVHWQADTMRV